MNRIQKLNNNLDIKSSGIYIIKNKLNFNCYVGSSYNIKIRLNHHYSSLKRNDHKNRHLQNAWNKYGESSFEFIAILNCPKEYNTKLEQWVKDKSEFNCLYNIAVNCESNLGLKHSKESKIKISEKAKGRKWDSSYKQLFSKIKKEKLKDPKYKQKLINNLPKDNSGEKSEVAKLKESDVIQIIDLINQKEKLVDIAKKFNIDARQISNIKLGKSWKYLFYLIKIK